MQTPEFPPSEYAPHWTCYGPESVPKAGWPQFLAGLNCSFPSSVSLEAQQSAQSRAAWGKQRRSSCLSAVNPQASSSPLENGPQNRSRFYVPLVAAPGDEGAQGLDGADRDRAPRGVWEGSAPPSAPSSPAALFLQAMEDPGMSLLDQSVIKKGRDCGACAGAKPGKTQ